MGGGGAPAAEAELLCCSLCSEKTLFTADWMDGWVRGMVLRIYYTV